MLSFRESTLCYLGVYRTTLDNRAVLLREVSLADVAAALSVPIEALRSFLEARRSVLTAEVKLENKGPREPELRPAVCSKCGHRWREKVHPDPDTIRCPDCRDWTGRWLTEYDEPVDESVVEVCNRILAEDEGHADMALTKKALRAYRRLHGLQPDPELAED